MAERRERTPEEREAARLERQRRRFGITDQPEYERQPEQFVDWAAYEQPRDAAPDGQNGEARAETRRAEPPVEHAEPPIAPAAPPVEHAEPPIEQALPPVEPAPRVHDPVGPETQEYRIEEANDAIEAPAHEDEVPDNLVEVPSGTRRGTRVPAAATSAPRSRRRAPAPAPRQPRSNENTGRRGHSWAGRVVALIALIVAAAIIWFCVELFQPFGTSPHGRVTVVVPPRSSAGQIATLLSRDGVISSAFFFKLRADLSGQRSDLRSGTYHLQQGMSYGAVLTALTKAPRAAPTTPLTLAEGHTRQYVARLLRRQGVKGNYLAETRSSRLLNPHSYGAPRHVPSLEGFLFPDTFTLVTPIKMSTLVADQLKDFKQRFATVNLSYARSKHLSAYDVLKIASLLQGEGASRRDFSLVASVIYNRLHDGMMLQMDSTTRYATGNFTGPLTVSELHSSSPYNTRTHLGLPPTPIDSPGMDAIEAAAHPAHTNYLYFFTKPCSTQTVYASSYNQFLHLLAVDKKTHCP